MLSLNQLWFHCNHLSRCCMDSLSVSFNVFFPLRFYLVLSHTLQWDDPSALGLYCTVCLLVWVRERQKNKTKQNIQIESKTALSRHQSSTIYCTHTVVVWQLFFLLPPCSLTCCPLAVLQSWGHVPWGHIWWQVSLPINCCWWINMCAAVSQYWHFTSKCPLLPRVDWA